MRGGRPEVDDWSWASTRRRFRTLYGLARPYRGRTALAIVSLVAATAASLAPPLLVGRAIDEVRDGRTARLVWLVAAFVAASAAATAFGYGQTCFTGWTGERM